jgi:hypothetical protein
MLEQPEPFNFYTFSPLFILAFLTTHGKREIGEWLPYHDDCIFDRNYIGTNVQLFHVSSSLFVVVPGGHIT